MLEVKNLTVSAGSRLILSDLNLAVQDGEVAALMGPNGSGKSTLSYVVAGRKDFTVESGEILLNGENILDDEPNVRAAKGLFLAFQYPIEIPGVAALTFLKSAMNSQRKHRGEAELSTPDFMKRVKASASKAWHNSGYAQACAQCRLFGRREEAHGYSPDDASRAYSRYSR